MNSPITPEISQNIFMLVDEYYSKSKQDISSIEVELGLYGYIMVKDIKELESDSYIDQDQEHSMISGILSRQDLTLFTDYSTREPYKRHGGLYGCGVTFDHLGDPVVENKIYREFKWISEKNLKHTYFLEKFRYNKFFKTVKFGMIIKRDKVEIFVKRLRALANK